MIRVGIGGWTYRPWRGTFYPPGVRQADELAYASRRLTTIEISGTLYRGHSPTSFRKWRDGTPDGFVFSVKGHRAVTNRRRLTEAREPLEWFFKTGVLELGDKLGPLLWQFPPHKAFDAGDLGGFLKLLPRRVAGRPLQHVVEVRHESFLTPSFTALLREHSIAVAYADSDAFPAIADVTADFVYARLQRSREEHETGYAAADLDRWAQRARTWASGGTPEDLPRIDRKMAAKAKRPVFVYVVRGAKIRAPAAALALIERIGD